jgi:TPR repeat protein
MYLDGIGVQPDYQMACTFLKAAVAKGNVFAMGQLVSIYYRDLMYNSAIELAST